MKNRAAKITNHKHQEMTRIETPVRYPNGDLQCVEWKDRIDLAVCITRSTRDPERCARCPFNL